MPLFRYTRRMRAVLVVIILITAVISAYWEVRNYGFITYDDPEYIVDNERVKQGLTADNLRWAFDLDGHVANWHPLTWLSHMLDCELFGEDAGKHHLVNVGLHALNAVLLLGAMACLTRAFWPSAALALLWAVHPLRVESVAWVSERKDLLSALFGLAALLAYAWYAGRPKLLRGASVFIALALGLMCKPMLVTWPCLMLLLDVWPLRRWPLAPSKEPIDRDRAAQASSPMTLLLEKVPLVLLVIGSCILTFRAQRSGGAVVEESVTSRLSNAAVSLARYLGDTFWPTDMALFYPRPSQWPVWIVAGAIALLVAITVASLAWWRRMPWLLVGWLWFVGTLVPVLGLVQVGEQAMADRYTYLPQIGIILGVVWTVTLLGNSRRAMLAIVVTAAAAALWLQTRHQTGFWRDNTTLYSHAIAVTDGNPMMEVLMAGEAEKRGDPEAAAAHRRRALELRPDSTFLLAAFAEESARAGDLTQAAILLDRAVALDGQNPLWLNNLAWLLATSPDPRVRTAPRVLELAQRACDLTDPQSMAYAGYLDTLAAALAAAGRFEEARATAKRALELALERNQKELIQQILSHLQQYENNQPAR
jgi:hypothetical protein